MVVLNTELEQWWYSTEGNSSNGGTQQETRAMVVLNRMKLEQWWYSTEGNSSNGGTQQKETQRDDMRDNQTCVKSGPQPRIRRGSSGYRKNGSGC